MRGHTRSRIHRFFCKLIVSATPAPRGKVAEFAWRKRLIWLPFALIAIVCSADLLTAAQQKRLLKVAVTKHVMAALQRDADKPIDQTLRAHWITTNEDGDIEGRISALDSESADSMPIKKLTVSLLKQGKRISKAKTNSDGRFVLKDVGAGVYTLVASGKTGFLAYGVHVLPRLEELDLDAPDELDAKIDRTPERIRQRQAYYVSHFKLPLNAVVAEELQIDAAAVPPEFSTLRKISQNYLKASSAMAILADQGDLKAISEANVINGGFQFSLSDEGNFHGRLQPIATEDGKPSQLFEMNLFLVQDDVEITRVAAEENGDFKIDAVEPGVYSLIAAGKDGFAAMSLELVAANDAEPQPANAASPVTQNFHRVSTATFRALQAADNPKANTPSLGIAIVTDPSDLKFLRKEIRRIAPAIQDVVDNGPPLKGFNGGNAEGFGPNASGGFAPGGFAPGRFAPGGFAPGPIGGDSFVSTAGFPAGFTSKPLGGAGFGAAGIPRLFGGGGGRVFSLLGLAGGVVAIADDDSPEPAPVSSAITGN